MFASPTDVLAALADTGHDDFRVAYAGDFTSPLDFGAWGILPVGGFSTGDLIALRPLVGRPIADWPAVEVSHHGDGAATFASSTRTLVAGWIARYGFPHHPSMGPALMQAADALIGLGAALGDEGAAERIVVAIEEGRWAEDTLPSAVYGWIEPEGASYREFLETYERVLVCAAEPVAAWRAFVARHPGFAPGRQLLFGALAKAGEPAADAAWDVVNLDRFFDNFYATEAVKAFGSHLGFPVDYDAPGFAALFEEDPAAEAARHLVEAGDERDDPVWGVVAALAEDDGVAAAWKTAARALEAAGAHDRAYDAWHSAAASDAADGEEHDPETLQGGLRCARALGDENLSWILEQAAG